MSVLLDELRQSMSAYASRFDPSLLSAAEAGRVARIASQISSIAAAVEARAAARAAESDAWKKDGYRSAAEAHARATGTSAEAARRAIETGRRLSGQPDLAAAVASGSLSIDQTEVVASGVEADPSKTQELMDTASTSSLGELRREVARVRANAIDQERRRAERHAKRSLRYWTDEEGGWHARIYGHPEDGVIVRGALDPLRRWLNMRRRSQGCANERFEALDYDAIVALANLAYGTDTVVSPAEALDLGLFPFAAPEASPPFEAPPPDLFGDRPPPHERHERSGPGSRRRARRLAGSPAKIMVRVDLDALLRGYPVDGELCDLNGVPVPVSAIKELASHGDAFLAGILTKSEKVVGVYHHGRRPTVHQSTLLEFLQPICVALGCNATTGLETDHRIDWAKTHYTLLDLLDRLCWHHHSLKTRENWALVAGTGKRAFVPPSDPRHPGRGARSAEPVAIPP